MPDVINPQIRQWTEEELRQAKSGDDLWLTTLLLNQGTWDSRTCPLSVPYRLRRRYIVYLDTEELADQVVEINAPDDDHALRFARALYIPEAIMMVDEQVTTYRCVFAREGG